MEDGGRAAPRCSRPATRPWSSLPAARGPGGDSPLTLARTPPAQAEGPVSTHGAARRSHRRRWPGHGGPRRRGPLARAPPRRRRGSPARRHGGRSPVGSRADDARAGPGRPGARQPDGGHRHERGGVGPRGSRQQGLRVGRAAGRKTSSSWPRPVPRHGGSWTRLAGRSVGILDAVAEARRVRWMTKGTPVQPPRPSVG